MRRAIRVTLFVIVILLLAICQAQAGGRWLVKANFVGTSFPGTGIDIYPAPTQILDPPEVNETERANISEISMGEGWGSLGHFTFTAITEDMMATTQYATERCSTLGLVAQGDRVLAPGSSLIMTFGPPKGEEKIADALHLVTVEAATPEEERFVCWAFPEGYGHYPGYGKMVMFFEVTGGTGRFEGVSGSVVGIMDSVIATRTHYSLQGTLEGELLW